MSLIGMDVRELFVINDAKDGFPHLCKVEYLNQNGTILRYPEKSEIASCVYYDYSSKELVNSFGGSGEYHQNRSFKSYLEQFGVKLDSDIILESEGIKLWEWVKTHLIIAYCDEQIEKLKREKADLAIKAQSLVAEEGISRYLSQNK